ncbi:hypothetical protein PLICRDRAFT_170232 [Plicaturopsis crispa FD-325 SS-3]|nr:hypothetical protein PLICRDRAFT_170232 [Plicaturopsis crispa FD-325 SS-3]
MPIPQYLPHLVYSLAVTSISIHLLWQRKTADAERAKIAGQISILESIVHDFRSGKHIPDVELERLKKLARERGEPEIPEGGLLKEEIGWREVFFGRKRVAGVVRESEWDRRDLEKARQEMGLPK